MRDVSVRYSAMWPRCGSSWERRWGLIELHGCLVLRFRCGRGGAWLYSEGECVILLVCGRGETLPLARHGVFGIRITFLLTSTGTGQ